ncbi:hypothetical protein [Corynebacterium terpenotabidum]|uniref:Integral membrane protein n=1 Tax=Corynebacterium terpenotabidum Y-11 TaxID=1200352 RepID=S4XFN3_9CORY|nr:hypothetical protein [Corynebacterium terpenotabidum]AGP31371.1 hypothetical protein A606_08640 [Corynebacterium terpenotabidum Y-11]
MSADDRRVPRDTQDDNPLILPPSIRYAGWLGMIEGGLGVIVAVIMIVRELGGVDDPDAAISGYGTAAWFAFFGGIIALAGWFLTQGRRWGRGPVAMTNMILVLVSVYMFSSGRIDLGLPTVIIGVVGMGLLFNSSAVDWAAKRYDS